MPKLDNLKVISCLSKKAKFGIDDPDVMNLYKVEINTDDEGKVKDVEDIERKRDELKAKFMNPADVYISLYYSYGFFFTATGENKRKWTANSTIRNQIRNYVYFVDLEETNAPLLDMILRGEFVALLASS
ncbi:14401_t:CDS:2 [Rhizophagus irregularis]|nr:14401_t:CDS:2 [Rhizophagus irregularis]